MNYEEEVRKVYPIRSDISCEFYMDNIAKENLWHVDIIDYEAKRLRCIGKALFAKDAWRKAYSRIQSVNQK